MHQANVGSSRTVSVDWVNCRSEIDRDPNELDLPESPLRRGMELFLWLPPIKSIELSRRRALTALSGAMLRAPNLGSGPGTT